MPTPEDTLAQHWDQLVDLGLASERPPPGIGVFPLPGSPWHMVRLTGEDTGFRTAYVHEVVVNALRLNLDLVSVIEGFRSVRDTARRAARRSLRRGLLLQTLFLPTTLVGQARPYPARPGSTNTQGMALLGFTVTVALVGLVISLFTEQWMLAGVCVYWWAGAKLLQRDFRDAGLDV